ncbi:FtsX-like permease family protein [Roseivirga thermotolerans]|uniref:ABC transporter permease n=1 Tax=Roseivirga thermotolerans TaxID=1758176 RepID=A0ABQ3I9R3_9BACT|nr:FtsX-like permease family protein [Roseivirga thermotolerans]GHE63549.1 ABC transporter permease [Roseivirga thermotolerans]
MLKNYITSTFRSFRKNRAFALINILGLSLGLTASIFVLQYAFFQLSFDKHNSKSDRIFRVINERFEGDRLIQRGQITYSAVGPQLAADYPEVVNHTTVNTFVDNVFLYDNHPTPVSALLLAEPSYAEMFDLGVLAGNPETMLSGKYQLVLTESMAQKVFQKAEANWADYLGTTVLMGSSRQQWQLTAVIADPPANSSLQYEAILSRETVFSLWGESARYSWTGSDYFHYIELAEGVDPRAFEQKLQEFSDKYFRGDEVTGNFEKFHLQSLEDIYLYSDYEYEIHKTADGRMVWILILVAVFIMLMAWVNYVNLTTSRSLQRAKEVGIRKVAGASRAQLIRQYLTESILLNLIAFTLAVTLGQALQVSFNNLIEEQLSLISFGAMQMGGLPVAVWMLIILLIGSLCSGLYPAFVLSSFKPSQTLKGDYGKSAQGQVLRKSLVTFQFILSTALIAGTYLVVKQTKYMKNQDLGVNLEQVLTVEGPSITSLDTTFVTHIHAFLDALQQNPNVISAGTSQNVFGSRLPRTFDVKKLGDADGHMLNRMAANYGFFNVYEIEMLAGRGFRKTDHNREFDLINNAILNEKAAKILGFQSAQEALNQKIFFFGKEWNVVGITSNFHHRSLKESIEPLLILPFYDGGGDTYHIRLGGNNIKETIAHIESTYNDFFPGDIFEYAFMDTRFNNLYKSDVKFGKVFNLFSLLAISIACLGLFGLVGYTAIQKTKEIGIRKVLGASVADILRLLSKEFMVLILLANALGLPLVYWGAENWLARYEYQTPIGIMFFVLPVAAVLLISAIIIASQTLKTARLNPVQSLRQE